MTTPLTVSMINKQEALDVISRELMIEKGINPEQLNKHLYARCAALVIELGGSIEKAKSYGLSCAEKAMGANAVLGRLNRPEGVDFNAYDQFMELLFKLDDNSDTTQLKRLVNELQLNNIDRIIRKTIQVRDVMHMGATLNVSVDFVTKHLK